MISSIGHTGSDGWFIVYRSMPRKCSIIGCRGNYNKRKGETDDNKVSVFRFPKDTQRRAEWLRKIPQGNLHLDEITDDMVICEKHFDPRFVIRDWIGHRPDGSTFTFPRDAPCLTDDAMPTLFPNVPSYLSSAVPQKRKNPDDRRADLDARDNAMFRSWLDEDIVHSFDDFKSQLSSQAADILKEWTVVYKTDFVLFLYVDLSSCPTIVASFKVLQDMTLHIYDSAQELDTARLVYLLGDDLRVSRWSHLPNICSHLLNLSVPSRMSTDDVVQIIVGRMRQLVDDQNGAEESKIHDSLNFLLEQFQLLFAVQKRYSPQCLLLAFKIYCSSRSTYSYLRDSCLTLPHMSYLRQLSSCFSESSKTLTGDDSHFVYLKQKCSMIAEHERLSALLIDEIYVSPKIDFKGGSLQGFAENTAADADSVEATTVQAFMLTSVLSKNKDIAALQPVKNLDASFLNDSLLKVIRLVEQAGYKVVVVISDNNRVNRNALAALCGGDLRPSIEHPCDPTRRLFFLFDSVHLLKCIRNIWLNQIDQVFWFPDLTTGETRKAAFAHLKQLYDSESRHAKPLLWLGENVAAAGWQGAL